MLDAQGHALITRRALGKVAWPGVWTNACCGHPRPGEDLEVAVRRRLGEELGLGVRDLRLVLPDFRYRAVDASGIVENEVCPVFTAIPQGEPVPSPEEVMDLRWVTADELAALARLAPWTLSPWAVAQLEQLGDRLGRLPAETS